MVRLRRVRPRRRRRRPPGPPGESASGRGFALLDALIALVLLGLGAAALFGLLRAATAGERDAAFEGRRVEAAQRALDRLRGGQVTADTGTLRLLVGGESFEVAHALPGAGPGTGVRLRVAPADGGPGLDLGPARVAP